MMTAKNNKRNVIT